MLNRNCDPTSRFGTTHKDFAPKIGSNGNVYWAFQKEGQFVNQQSITHHYLYVKTLEKFWGKSIWQMLR